MVNFGFWGGTIFFAVVEAVCVGVCQVTSKQKDKALLGITLISTAVVCSWSMWAIIYIAQMNPLVRPILAGG
ncbi:hypothetical protein WJX74_007542 [Apatococcus lobatus]|uniref:Uncharacterized protein n=2 Tax=Apatococcus TaxID=904362 RepID=A0AAW1SQR1_9CHLO